MKDKHLDNYKTDSRGHGLFIRMAEARLRDAQTRIVLIRTRIDRAVERGRIAPSPQLEKATNRAVAHLGVVERSLTKLQHADEVAWRVNRYATERALDDLARSIKSMINRIP